MYTIKKIHSLKNGALFFIANKVADGTQRRCGIYSRSTAETVEQKCHIHGQFFVKNQNLLHKNHASYALWEDALIRYVGWVATERRSKWTSYHNGTWFDFTTQNYKLNLEWKAMVHSTPWCLRHTEVAAAKEPQGKVKSAEKLLFYHPKSIFSHFKKEITCWKFSFVR